MSDSTLLQGPLGGAANWAGSEHERSLGAYLAVHVLAARPLRVLAVPNAVPLDVQLQANAPVDDVVCTLAGGGRAYFQARTSITMRADRSTGLRWVVAQWKALERMQPLDPARDRVVAVSQRRSERTAVVAEQLIRGRASARALDTKKQQAALATLESLLGDLAAERRRAVIASAVLWNLETADRASEAVQRCLDILAHQVTTSEYAIGAWDRLMSLCGEGARLRLGYDADALRDVLRTESIPLRADRPGSPGARRATVARYRERVRREGMLLTFAGLAATIPPIEFDTADAEIRVVEHSPAQQPDREFGYLLWWVLRRRGRLLLTGLPGAGKSTAVKRLAAEYADRRRWPLPILVRVGLIGRLLNRKTLSAVAHLHGAQGQRSPLGLATDRVSRRRLP